MATLATAKAAMGARRPGVGLLLGGGGTATDARFLPGGCKGATP
jgi:hypothetical protein